MKKNFLKQILLILSIIAIVYGCKKNENTINNPPSAPHSPVPANNVTNLDTVSLTLKWSACTDPEHDSVVYDLYFGKTAAPALKASNLKDTSYATGTLEKFTTYYWKVVAKDKHNNSTPGPVWSFTTDTVTVPNKALINQLDGLLGNAYAIFSWDQAEETNISFAGEWMFGDFLSDDVVKGGDGPADLSEFNNWRVWEAPVYGSIASSQYYVAYYAISSANTAIDQIKENRMAIGDSISYKRLLGEALFIKSWFYFNLAKGFVQVPDKDGSVIKMLGPDSLYAKIEKDLKQAITLLPLKSKFKSDFNLNPGGRGTKGAAEAILAKVIMMEIGFGLNGKTESNWQDVYNLAQDIINSGQYSLLSNYAMIFSPDGEQGLESVFETNACDCGQGYGHGGGNLEVWFTSVRTTAGSGNASKHIGFGLGFDAPTQDLYNEFEPGDPRLPNTILKNGDIVYEDGDSSTNEQIAMVKNKDCPTGYNLRKYMLYNAGKIESCNSCADNNKRLLRYADVILIAAEAAYHLGMESQARNYVNIIRERARNSSAPKGSVLYNAGYPAPSGDPGLLPDITASGADLLNAIKHERRVELALEGHRTWDLYRWGDYENAIQKYVPADVSLGGISASTVISNMLSHSYNPHGIMIPAMPIPNTEIRYGVTGTVGYSY